MISSLEKNKAINSLFFIQMFSTLGFAILQFTLVLFQIHKLQLPPTIANELAGSFSAFNFGLHLVGGYLSGRFISNRHLFSIGMILQLIGCIIISQCSYLTMIVGLSLFLTGSGLNVTCINNMVTQLFEENDNSREKAFLWNYSGMNLGFFLGLTISGYFELSQNYSWLFLCGAIGNIGALLIMLIKWKLLKDKDTYLTEKSKDKQIKELWKAYAGILIIFTALIYFLKNSNLSNKLIFITGMLMLLLILIIAIRYPEVKFKNRMFAFFILTISSSVFWALYYLAPMGLTIFADNNVNRNIFGIIISPQWINNINTIIIVIGGPTMAFLLNKLRNKGIKISNPFLFFLALLFIGLGFIILPIGIKLADDKGMVAFIWIFLSYTFQSVGELCLNPIGYAMIGHLIPRKLQGLMMGIWMMNIGVASIGSSYISNEAIKNLDIKNPILTNPSFSNTFTEIGSIALLVAILLYILRPWLDKMIYKHDEDISIKQAMETKAH